MKAKRPGALLASLVVIVAELPLSVAAASTTSSSSTLSASIPSAPTACASTADVWLSTTANSVGDWNAAVNWSSGVPSSSSDVCLPAGTYTVTITTNNAVASTLEILSGASLKIEGNVIPGYASVNATLTATGTIANAGNIVMTEKAGSEGGSANLVDTTSAVENFGSLSTTMAPADTGSNRNIDASLVNYANFTVAAPTDFTLAGGAVSNASGATMTTTSGVTMTVGQSGTTGPNFTLAGGSIVNQGNFLQYGGSFTHAAGNATGNPLDLDGVTLDASLGAGTGSGSANFAVFDNSTLTGNVAATDSISVDGYTRPNFSNNTANLTATGNITNAGTITLTESPGAIPGAVAGAGANLVDTTGTITNTGTIEAIPSSSTDTWGRGITAPIVNEGLVDIEMATVFTGPGYLLTDNPGGVFKTGVGVTMTVGQSGTTGPNFTLAGGSIVNQGNFLQYGGSFTHAAGNATGNPLDLDGVTLDASLGAGTGSGSANFAVFDNSTLTGNVAATDSISVDGYTRPNFSNNTANLTATGNITNAGTITLTESPGAIPGAVAGAGANLVDTTGTITNTGTIEAIPSSSTDTWGRGITAPIVNEGLVDIEMATALNDSGATYVQNSGTTTINVPFDASAEGGLTITGGIVNGTGTLTGTLSNTSGMIQPGSPGTPGTLSVNGNFVQGASGVLDAQINGVGAGSHSQLSVTGNVTLAGSLAAQPSTAYAAAATLGDTFAVVNYGGSRSGSFTNTGVAPQNTVAPTISGTLNVGQTLTCSSGTFTDSPTTYAYQWNRNGTAITGASANHYTVTLADSGATLTCTVTASGGVALAGGNGFSEVNNDPSRAVDVVVGTTFTSLPGEATSAGVSVLTAPIATANPVISGTPVVGQQLSCSQGTWTNGPTSFSFAWRRANSAIAGATSSSYTVVSADAGLQLTCAVTASNTAGSNSATSAGVTVAGAPAATANPVISGTPVVSQQLSCSQGTWTNGPTSFSFAWRRANSAIAGATSSSYTVVSADAGLQLTCAVTASNTAGSNSATSAGVTVAGAPAATANPVISGTPVVGQQLSCSQGTWTNVPTSFSFAWRRANSVIVGATSSSYTVVSADVLRQLTCTVTASNTAGSNSATSSPVTVRPGPVSIVPATLTEAVGANPYDQSVTACGGELPSCEHWSSASESMVDANGTIVTPSQSFTFTQTSGSLPPGLTLSSSGLLSGTPTQTGTYSFTLTAADPIADVSPPLSFSITVVPGMSVSSADGSYRNGGPITTGSVVVTPDGAGAITGVTTSTSFNNLFATIAGSSPDSQIGVQVSDFGSMCTTELQIAGASGTVLSAPGIAISGCGTSSALALSPAAHSAHVTSGSASIATPSPVAAGGPTAQSAPPSLPPLLVSSSGVVLSPPGSYSAILGSGSGMGMLFGPGTYHLTLTLGPGTLVAPPGSYPSALNQSAGSTSPFISAVALASPIPAVLPITPITTLVDAYEATQSPAVAPNQLNLSTPQSTMASLGYRTNATILTPVPNFSSTATTTGASMAGAILASLQSQAAQMSLNSGSLVSALSAEITAGAFKSGLLPIGTPKNLPSASNQVLPTTAGTSIFKVSIPSFQAGSSSYVPALPAPSLIKQTLPAQPVVPLPGTVPTASITRIGPAAFVETIFEPTPLVARSPFSPSGTTFTIEVVAAS